MRLNFDSYPPFPSSRFYCSQSRGGLERSSSNAQLSTPGITPTPSPRNTESPSPTPPSATTPTAGARTVRIPRIWSSSSSLVGGGGSGGGGGARPNARVTANGAVPPSSSSSSSIVAIGGGRGRIVGLGGVVGGSVVGGGASASGGTGTGTGGVVSAYLSSPSSVKQPARPGALNNWPLLEPRESRRLVRGVMLGQDFEVTIYRSSTRVLFPLGVGR